MPRPTPNQIALLVVAAAGQLYRSTAARDTGRLFTLSADGRRSKVANRTACALWDNELIIGIGEQGPADLEAQRERLQPTIKGAAAVARQRSSVQIVNMLVQRRG